MKKKLFILSFFLFGSIAVFADVDHSEMSDQQLQQRVETLNNRVEEIKNMDLSSLEKSEKKEIKKELKEIKKEIQKIDLSQRLSLSLGAIIIIILLIILLL